MRYLHLFLVQKHFKRIEVSYIRNFFKYYYLTYWRFKTITNIRFSITFRNWTCFKLLVYILYVKWKANHAFLNSDLNISWCAIVFMEIPGRMNWNLRAVISTCIVKQWKVTAKCLTWFINLNLLCKYSMKRTVLIFKSIAARRVRNFYTYTIKYGVLDCHHREFIHDFCFVLGTNMHAYICINMCLNLYMSTKFGT